MALRRTGYFKFNTNTRENVRKEFTLDNAGAMDQSIDILYNWIQKQEHFTNKDFSREYLEGFIISSKGSVEKAKARIDKICIMRTMVPRFFEKSHAIKDFPNLREFYIDVLMPNLTEDDCRIHVGKFMTKTLTVSAFLQVYQYFGIVCEYSILHDYNKGYHAIYDMRDTSIVDLMAHMDFVNFRTWLSLVIEAYGLRLRSATIITPSKAIYTLLNIVKPFLSPKISERIRVLTNIQSLYEVVPKKLLPKDLGGEQKCILDLFDEMNEAVSTEEHLAHLEKMKQSRTNEELRYTENCGDEYLGMPGSFKMLNVD